MQLSWQGPGRKMRSLFRNGLDMFGSRSATTPNDIHQGLLQEFSDLQTHGFGILVVGPKGVG